MHPYEREELEMAFAPRPGTAEYGKAEAELGAGWNGPDWNKDRPWLLTMYDVWVTNPHYYGPPGAPHPEDDPDPEALAAWDAFAAAWWAAEEAGLPHPELTVYAPAAPVPTTPDEDLPF